MVSRVVSGGQTGVDRAALDAAMALGIPCGGWCPRDRRAEDGPLARKYPLRETPLPQYAQRTEWNVRDADGTLVVCPGAPSGGTRLTLLMARRHGRPALVVPPSTAKGTVGVVRSWLRSNAIRTLNVAGPRESTVPGIYGEAKAFLSRLLADPSRGSRGSTDLPDKRPLLL
jgi:hypothetical protein